jgi:hypothetical protein
MLRITIAFLFLTLLSLNVWAAVEVNYNKNILHFDNDERLSNIANHYAHKGVYWPASKLFSKSEPVPTSTSLKDTIANSDYTDELKKELNEIALYLEGFSFLKRISMRIDLDLARTQEELNPSFVDGEYLLTLTNRPKQLEIVGAVNQQTALPLITNGELLKYLSSVEISSNANNSFVYLIQATGAVQKLGIAYWNRENVIIHPGDTIFVPFKSPGFLQTEATNEINSQIIELLRSRV